MEGQVVMGEPSMRAIHMATNALGRSTRGHMVGNKFVPDSVQLGDANLIEVLMYVRKAPFQTTVDGFLEYCDQMEAPLDTALFGEMKMFAEEIEQGGLSPFGTSQAVGTPSSE